MWKILVAGTLIIIILIIFAVFVGSFIRRGRDGGYPDLNDIKTERKVIVEKIGNSMTVKESKHMAILHSINRLRRSIKGIQGLFDEVVGAVEEKSPKTEAVKPPGIPSLVNFLNSTPANIIELAEKIDTLVSDLRSELL